MANYKSLVIPSSIEKAKRKHQCSFQKKHIIKLNEFRLSIKVGRNFKTYCIKCGEKILERDLEKIKNLLNQIRGYNNLKE